MVETIVYLDYKKTEIHSMHTKSPYIKIYSTFASIKLFRESCGYQVDLECFCFFHNGCYAQ